MPVACRWASAQACRLGGGLDLTFQSSIFIVISPSPYRALLALCDDPSRPIGTRYNKAGWPESAPPILYPTGVEELAGGVLLPAGKIVFPSPCPLGRLDGDLNDLEHGHLAPHFSVLR